MELINRLFIAYY